MKFKRFLTQIIIAFHSKLANRLSILNWSSDITITVRLSTD